MKTEDFQSPESRLEAQQLGEVIIRDDAIASLISQESQSGRAVYLTVKVIKRLDGVFPIAGMIQSTGIAGQKATPSDQSANAEQSGAPGTGTNEGTAAGSGI